MVLPTVARFRPFLATFLVFAMSSSWSNASAAKDKSPVRISGVYFDGVLLGDPEPDSAIRITNAGDRTVNIGGFALTDENTPTQFGDGNSGLVMGTGDDNRDANARRRRGDKHRTMQLPAGAKIGPYADVWIANEGKAFRDIFGYLPDYEAVDTLPEVPDLEAGSGFLLLPAKHGTVALKNQYGEIVDFVAYDLNKEAKLTEQMLPSHAWKGPPLRLSRSSPFGWKGQVLRRDRDERGRLLEDTDSAKDWDSGFTRKQLGEDPTHRVELPGQSMFVSRPLKSVDARILATSAPDNNYKALIEAFERARETIRVSVYQMTNVHVGEALVKAQRRGVKVTVWLEGSPVGGIPDKERYIADRLAKAGVEVYFLGTEKKSRSKPRYRFDHSKYVIIDDKLAIIGTENYGSTGVPVMNSYGNRGWMVHIENQAFVRQLREVWDHDVNLALPDVTSIHKSPSDSYGLPYRDPNFRPDETIHRGLYEEPAKPVYVSGKADLELVLSPDTSLNEGSSIMGLIGRAKTTLFIQQNSVRRRWGGPKEGGNETPDLPLEAVIAAARRGVKVRVLLDGTWYNVQGDESRDNDDTVALLNSLAQDEGLDIEAKIINLESAHLEKIHAKGIIVDGNEVFVGSINWTENSFKGNREVGVIIGNKKVAGYYERLFLRDWSDSRMYRAELRSDVRLHRDADERSKADGSLKRGETVTVVGEHWRGSKRGPAWLEVRLKRGKTRFIQAGAIGVPVASPVEAIHLVGRRAEIEGRVTSTRVSEKVIQLRMGDEERPEFMAVIFRKSEERFRETGLDPAQAYQGRIVRVRGRVQTYKVPEIILSKPDQITLVP